MLKSKTTSKLKLTWPFELKNKVLNDPFWSLRFLILFHLRKMSPFFFFFGHSERHMGSFFPIQGLNLWSMRGTGGLSLKILYFWWETSYLNFTCLWTISALVWIESMNTQSLYQRNFHFKSLKSSKGHVQFILFLVYNFGRWLPLPYT